jgi:AcrR family transcriptional regulator
MSASATTPTSSRRRRANGEASREKILDAAAEIAGERGYDGTSISLVSERSGLPASSIYWHFNNKDELIAAVIDRSFQTWLAHLARRGDLPAETPAADALRYAMQRTGTALTVAPDFLRLGLMLILERRPEEPSARTKFLEVRQLTHANTVRLYATLFPELTDEAHQRLATFTLAAADGILVAHEIEHIDMTEAFDLLASAILGAVADLRRAESASHA